MGELVGKALEEDDQFYKDLFGAEEEDDEEFSASSAGEDSFDSDFNQTEKSDQEQEVEEEKSK